MAPKKLSTKKKPKETGGWIYTTPSTCKGKSTPFNSYAYNTTHYIIKGELTFQREGVLPVRGSKRKPVTRSQIERDDVGRFQCDIAGIVSAKDIVPIAKGVMFNVMALHARDGEAKFVEGYEVLSCEVRDKLLKRGDISWEVGGEHEGRVDRGVRAEGDVSATVLEGIVLGTGSGNVKKVVVDGMWKMERGRRAQDSSEEESGGEDSGTESEEEVVGHGRRKGKEKEVAKAGPSREKGNGKKAASRSTSRMKGSEKGESSKSKEQASCC
ncbi:uncharacterized protein LY89DRAFT_733252 [Mollisia scopiformis]|uniref:Uncharacterized protein n=1 Tax=Mollisia scopiformis TaxID=149040 RepID=A0A194XB75_MOLSC|nr:uncharacterized protein LY89DRAFT_733252 [Mollisia scopiformis]KUJ17399.1 hypothetical protein LY89DRAFT_733252 [Mollisia scopiformis]